MNFHLSAYSCMRPLAVVIALPVIGLLWAAALLWPINASERALSFEERVAYERRVQAVYFRYRTGSARTDRTFDQVLPRSVSEARIDEILRRSAALETIFDTRITPEMLQDEVRRMSRETRRPDRLRELYAALDDDPYIVAEAIARPNLVDRLSSVREYFGKEWHNEKDRFPAELETDTFQYEPLRIVSEGPQTDDSWRPMPVMPENMRPRMAAWTGTEMLVWGGGPEQFSFKVNSGSRYNPATDIWLPTGLRSLAPGRRSSGPEQK
jgi:hypothetical protein